MAVLKHYTPREPNYAYNMLLIIFIPLISFSLIPNPNGWVKDNLYPVRLALTIAFPIIAGLWIIHIKSNNTSISAHLRSKRPSGLFWVIGIYIAWAMLSAFFSYLPGYAWIGHPYTQFGTLSMIGCILLASVYLYANVNSTFIKVFSITSLIMFITAFLEAIGIHPLKNLIFSEYLTFPAATIGHRPHLAGWFAILSTAAVFFYRHKKYDAWFWIWSLSALLGVTICVNSSATLGVILSLIPLVVLSLKNAKRKTPSLLLLLGIFGMSLLYLPNLTNHLGTTLGTKPPNFKSYVSAATLETRSLLWKSALNASLERPVFGWGDDTFAFQVFNHLTSQEAESLIRKEFSFGKEYTIERKGATYFAFVKGKEKETMKYGTIYYMRPHNILMDELYSRGFPGLFLSLTIVILVFVSYAKKSRLSTLYMFLSIIPYAFYLFAWFFVNSVAPLAFVMLGLMLASIRGEDNGNQRIYSA